MGSEWLTKKLAVPPERPSSKAGFKGEQLSRGGFLSNDTAGDLFTYSAIRGRSIYGAPTIVSGARLATRGVMVNKTERSVPSRSLYSSEEEREEIEKQRIRQDAFYGARCYKGINRAVQWVGG